MVHGAVEAGDAAGDGDVVSRRVLWLGSFPSMASGVYLFFFPFMFVICLGDILFFMLL